MTNYLNIEQQRHFNIICVAFVEAHPKQFFNRIERVLTYHAVEHSLAEEILTEIASIGGRVGAMADEFILAEI